ncbi:MAG: hypothetical protein ACK58M_19850, partial [Acidobacteriota bacterium]
RPAQPSQRHLRQCASEKTSRGSNPSAAINAAAPAVPIPAHTPSPPFSPSRNSPLPAGNGKTSLRLSPATHS